MKLRLIEKLGDGAFADVWRARDDELEREVAVKIIREASLGVADALAHAKALARASHHNVVSVFDIAKIVDPDTGVEVDCVVMELLQGVTLAERLKNKELSLSEALNIGIGIINGLSHIHAQGMTHGDLHEENVMVVGDTSKVIDILYLNSLAQLSTQKQDAKLNRDLLSLRLLLQQLIIQSEVVSTEATKFNNLVTGASIYDMRIAFSQTLSPANANKEAPLSKDAESARLELETLKAQLAWRTVSPQQHDQLVEIFKNRRMELKIGYVNGDPEVEMFAKEISQTLKNAGSITTTDRVMAMGGPMPIPIGLIVSQSSDRVDSEYFISALTKVGINAVGMAYTESPIVTMFDIIVGSKGVFMGDRLLSSSQMLPIEPGSVSEKENEKEKLRKKIGRLIQTNKHLEALELLRGLASENTPDVWRLRANSAFELGRSSRDSNLLEESIASWRKAQSLIKRAALPSDWANGQNSLGNALAELGVLALDKVLLKEAIAIHLEVLEVRSFEHDPLYWAHSQNNLGSALQALGRLEQDTAKIEGAAVAFREALRGYTRKREPLIWASTQYYLGNTLFILGKLNEAVTAYREALKELTLEREPLKWANIQKNLGSAFFNFARSEKGTEKLKDAAVACQSALKIYRDVHAKNEIVITENVLHQIQALIEQRKK